MHSPQPLDFHRIRLRRCNVKVFERSQKWVQSESGLRNVLIYSSLNPTHSFVSSGLAYQLQSKKENMNILHSHVLFPCINPLFAEIAGKCVQFHFQILRVGKYKCNYTVHATAEDAWTYIKTIRICLEVLGSRFDANSMEYRQLRTITHRCSLAIASSMCCYWYPSVPSPPYPVDTLHSWRWLSFDTVFTSGSAFSPLSH